MIPVERRQKSSTHTLVIWMSRLMTRAKMLIRIRYFLYYACMYLRVKKRITMLASREPKMPPTGTAPVRTGSTLGLSIISFP